METPHSETGDKGANMVEFALIAPFLILLLFGVVEFAWVFASNLDVKHGAREGARITAVNTPDTGNVDLAAEICSRMNLVGPNTATTITWASDGTPAVAESVTVMVSTLPRPCERMSSTSSKRGSRNPAEIAATLRLPHQSWLSWVTPTKSSM